MTEDDKAAIAAACFMAYVVTAIAAALVLAVVGSYGDNPGPWLRDAFLWPLTLLQYLFDL